ncbi:P-loop containing nucleoside triphosphate hydrolase protein [Fomitopsis serialis]|uniref:P-loop containing nucleoside triphosphate hydrolase protein n=1 Tax=Fomitopsis serialis TaxID=139415 RepID=UPI002007EBD5|nr:P-loop containing nucleoside triphosphate hydrolase protein [Neoantrodia serialis]KAH9930319.1 P-loop containing nucleoside triphosphate hydrolase protein [Neoantrodia serialis]
MDSDEDQRKGKGSATGTDEQYDKDNLPWVEKYRPVTLDDVVSHKDIIGTIEKFIEANRLPHLLFYGPPGTGKTSTVLAVARRIYGKDYRKQILELNASDDRGIDVGFKLIILDEADMMTTAAQAALRRVIEQYTKNVRFCIICNYVNKIIPAIQSRCTRFRFSPLPITEVERRLTGVIETKALKGDMRRALNVLQACHAAYDVIGETEIYDCTGSPQPADIETVVNSMLPRASDLINGAYEYIETIEFKPHARIYLLDFLATTEHRLSTGASEKIQLTALLGAFKNAVELSGKSS